MFFVHLQESTLVEDVQLEGVSLPCGNQKTGLRGHYGLQFVRTQLHLVGLRSEIAERALINLVSFARIINPINAQQAKNIKGCFLSVRYNHGKPENAGIDIVAHGALLRKK